MFYFLINGIDATWCTNNPLQLTLIYIFLWCWIRSRDWAKCVLNAKLRTKSIQTQVCFLTSWTASKVSENGFNLYRCDSNRNAIFWYRSYFGLNNHFQIRWNSKYFFLDKYLLSLCSTTNRINYVNRKYGTLFRDMKEVPNLNAL